MRDRATEFVMDRAVEQERSELAGDRGSNGGRFTIGGLDMGGATLVFASHLLVYLAFPTHPLYVSVA